MQRVRLPLRNMRVDGALLRQVRTGAGITQAVVAERAKISEQWLRRIELHSQQPSLPVTQDIADALSVPLAAFCVPDIGREAA